MPDRMKLDDSSYNNIYEKAMTRLERQAPWWTHKGIADPGITLIEMWALLCDMQSFYLDQLQESHYRKYLKLLGIAPDEGDNAFVWVSFGRISGEVILPEGTRLLADKMVFETGEEVKLTANRLTAFYLGREGTSAWGRNLINIMQRPRKTDFRLRVEDPLFSFELKEAVEEGGILNLFVLLDERQGRNPGGCMAKLSWEYLTDDGYREAQILTDDTHGLLYSGSVSLLMDAPMAKKENGAYPVRCRIKEGAFDVMPVIYRLSLNVVKVFQKNTLCREEYASFSLEYPQVRLKSYLALTGEIQVYIKCNDEEWEEFTRSCEITPPVTADNRERYVYFDKERFGRVPMEGNDTIKIVCSAAGFHDEYENCDITGISTQQITVQWDNLMRNHTSIMLRQGDGSHIFRQYKMEEPEEGRCRFAWHWQEEKNVIELGDGWHGEIPEYAKDGLRFTSVVLWEGENGNISIGKIREFERDDLFPGISCCNMLAGKGGRDRESPSEQFAGLRNTLFPLNRMVTRDDIRRLALKTPGLILRDVQVECSENRISVIIFPANPLSEKYCLEKYTAAVVEHLEPYRMINSRIEVKIGEDVRR